MKPHNPIQVKKFGGTSVGSTERIEAVAQRVLEDQKTGQSPLVVVSAMSGETNRLVALGEKIFPGHRGLAYDMLVASGEQVSVSLLSMAIEKMGGKARPYLAHQLGIKTDSMASKARIQNIRTESLFKDVQEGVIPVVAGFQGVDDHNNITTLGRGGTDTSAVALAAAVGSESCEIFTDVPAVFSADPRLVPKAREISQLSFEEMLEMASLGSKVLHVRSVEMGAKHNVKIHVRTTFERREGTWVVPEGEIVENPVVSSVTHDASTAVITIRPIKDRGPHVIATLFEELAAKGVVVDIVSQSHNEKGQRLAFSVPSDDLVGAKEIAAKQFGSDVDIETMDAVSKVSIVGVGMRNHPGVAAKFFRTLADAQIDIHLVTTSEIKVSAIVDRDNLQKAAQVLHAKFDLDA